MKFASLRAEIRHIVDAADKPLLSGEIFAQVTRRNVTTATFGVTLAQMVEAGQLTTTPISRERAGNSKSRVAYGPGATPVDARKEYRPERERLKGFRELAREADARQRGGG